MKTNQDYYWAIVDAWSRRPVIMDARVPVFWLKKVARQWALEHGHTTHGDGRDVDIMKVEIRNQKP